MKQIGDSPVYVVAPKTSGGPERTLHRDLLLPCGFLAQMSEATKDTEVVEVELPATQSDDDVPETLVGDETPESVEDDTDEEDYSAKEFFPKDVIIVETKICPVNEERQVKSLNPDAEVFCPKTSETCNVSSKVLEKTLPDAEPQVHSVQETSQDNMCKELSVPSVSESSLERVKPDSLDVKRDIDDDNDEASIVQPECPQVTLSETEPVTVQPKPVVEAELRRSTRQRSVPERLTYQSLGNPLVLVMQSLFSGLDKAFTQALNPENLELGQLIAGNES